MGLEPKNTLEQTTSRNKSSPKANTRCHQSNYKNLVILRPIKNKDIKYINNKKKKRKKRRSIEQIPRENDDEDNSKEDDDESVSGVLGFQERNRLDSESENDEKDNNNNNDKIYDGVDRHNDLDNESENRYRKIPQALRSKHNIGEWVDDDNYEEYEYDGDSDTSSADLSRSSLKKVPTVIPKDTTRRNSTSGELPRTTPRITPRVLRNEIKAMSGRKFTGTKLITYGNKIEEKKTGTIRISGFNPNGIKLDEIRATCQGSVDQQIDIQCFQEVCRDTRRSNIRQRFLTETKKSDRALKSVWGSSTIDVGSEYKPGGASIVAFGKTARRVVQQRMDALCRWSWMAFEGADNKVISVSYTHLTLPTRDDV